MFRDRPGDGFVGAGLVVHTGWPYWLSDPVYGQHRAGSAIDGERAATPAAYAHLGLDPPGPEDASLF